MCGTSRARRPLEQTKLISKVSLGRLRGQLLSSLDLWVRAHPNIGGTSRVESISQIDYPPYGRCHQIDGATLELLARPHIVSYALRSTTRSTTPTQF